MVCKNMKSEDSKYSNYQVRKIGGDNLICGNVLFWDDGKKLILTSDRACKLFSINTGEFIQNLFLLDSRIVSCFFHPEKKDVLIALSANGSVASFHLKKESLRVTQLVFSAKLLNKDNCPKFVTEKKFYQLEDFPNDYHWEDKILNEVDCREFLYGELHFMPSYKSTLIWASWSLKDETQCHISVFMYPYGKQMEKVRVPKIALKKCYKNFVVGTGQDKNLILVGMGMNFIFISYFMGQGLFKYFNISHLLGDDVEVRCLTFHPCECAFATADSRGKVVVWRNITERTPLKEVFDWHVSDINDMAFSGTGCYLLSGGDESVLVKWSLLAKTKDFLPRLSSAICYISVSEDFSLIALSLANNEIIIINNTFHKISSIQSHCIFPVKRLKKVYDILTVDPRTDYLVLNGKHGYLQFLSRENAYKLVYSMDIGKVNYMTGEKTLENLDITHCRFNKNGKWLVTVESRDDPVLFECRLKFWKFDRTSQSFALHTNMELPHDENKILALEVSNDNLVATSGSNKQFKLWALFHSGGKSVWSLLNIGKYRLLPCRPLEFSYDATLIAVGFGPSLTLWNTSTCALKCSLTTPFKRDELNFIKFGTDEYSHVIITASRYSLTAWNVITSTVMWNVELEVAFLTSSFCGTYMCVFSKKNTLFIFNPTSSTPEFVKNNVSTTPIISSFATTNYENENSFQLYFLNAGQELFVFKEDDDSSDSKCLSSEADSNLTRFAYQLAEKSQFGIITKNTKHLSGAIKVNPHYMSSILDAPAYTLPNPSRYCSELLASLSISIKGSDKRMSDAFNKVSDQNVKHHGTEDDDGEDDDDYDYSNVNGSCDNRNIKNNNTDCRNRCVDEVTETVQVQKNESKTPVHEKMLWKIVNSLFKK